MAFSSRNEICIKYGFDSTLSDDEILSKLTDMQVPLHPDSSPNLDLDNNNEFALISEAKKFLRSNYSTHNDAQIVPAELLKNLVEAVSRNNDYMSIRDATDMIEKAEQKYFSELEAKRVRFRQSFLTKKITIASVIAAITLVWSFPERLANHPLIRKGLP